MRIYLDANVLFSAAQSNGAVRRLLGLLHAAGHELWADGYVVEEARRNLALKSADGAGELERILKRVNVAGLQAAAPLPAEIRKLPEKDRPVLAAAIRLGCDALVTGDRTHFGAFYGRKIGGVTIHSPRSLAEALLD